MYCPAALFGAAPRRREPEERRPSVIPAPQRRMTAIVCTFVLAAAACASDAEESGESHTCEMDEPMVVWSQPPDARSSVAATDLRTGLATSGQVPCDADGEALSPG